MILTNFTQSALSRDFFLICTEPFDTDPKIYINFKFLQSLFLYSYLIKNLKKKKTKKKLSTNHTEFQLEFGKEIEFLTMICVTTKK